MKFSSLFSGWLGGVLGALALVLVGVVGWWILSPPEGEAPLEANAPAQTTAPETPPEAAPTSAPQAQAPTETTAAETQAEAPTAQTAPLLPSFDVVRVEPDGSALVAGRAEPGAKVSVLVDGRTVASTKADPGAGFVAMFDLATSPNDRVMTLETELADGTKLASEVSVIVEGVAPPRVLAQADTGVTEPGATEPATAEASATATPPQPEPAPAAETAPETAQATAPDSAQATTTAPPPADAQAAAPDASAPDAAAPATAAAEPAPQMAPQPAPETTPDSTAPAQPQTATAANVEPVPAEPATGASEPMAEQAPGATAPAQAEATQPEAAEPETAQPETGQIATAQPEAAQPETAQSETGQPDLPAAPAEPPTPTPEPQAPAPQAPRLLLAGPDGLRVLQDSGAAPQLSVDAITYDAAGEVGLSGRGQADETLHVYVDNTAVTTAEVGESGEWQVPLPDVGTGIHTLRVDSVDADGSVVRRVETPFHREDKDVLAAASSEAAATGQPLAAITVQPGNTLWAIAEGRYGEGIKYWTIFDANRDQIRDPHWIYPGQVFTLPQENP